MNTPQQQKIRIARFLAAAGLGSRRACETLIRDGAVTVNGAIVGTPAFRVDPADDEVRYRDRLVRPASNAYLVLHKPPGYTCSARDAHAERLVYELLPADLGRLFSVGRLDRESEGVLIVTNDGEFAERLAHPRFGVTKTYRVWCHGTLGRDTLAAMRRGVADDGEFLRPRRVRLLRRIRGGAVVELILAEGRKREVRRLCAHFGLRVDRLVREAVGSVTVQGLQPGEWRHLDDAEMTGLLEEPGRRVL